MVVLAPNQAEAASAIEKAGAAYSFDLEEGFPENLIARILRLRETPQELCAMSQAASDVTDGLGCMRVLDAMKGQV
jgi:UDP-N-acetylglucosamine:LPS N-acetylglucosamine transferase